MKRRKIDINVIRQLKKSVSSFHRSLFLIYGEKAKDQIIYLHHLLLKSRKEQGLQKPSVLWYYKKNLGLNIYENKRLKQLKKKYAGKYSMLKEDLLDHFLLSSNAQFCHVSESEKVLGQTFGMLIIQDFETITPNTLARLLECVEGGGLVLFLFPQITCLEDIFTLNMDVHLKYATEAYSSITPRFNKRFILSLNSCVNCIVLDDNLNIKMRNTKTESSVECKVSKVTRSNDTMETAEPFLSELLELCRTKDQTSSLSKIASVLQNCEESSIVTLTSGRGRGKSALLGLGISFALHYGYSNACVTSPHLENVQTLFSFVKRGLVSCKLTEGVDFKVFYNENSFITGLTVYKPKRKTVTYLLPVEHQKIGNADIVVVDEAAAIPLPLVKQWIHSNIVLMASTINGYEGTGRSLSLKLINQLRNQSETQKNLKDANSPILHELQLNEAIRYANGDGVEDWLNRLLCLDASVNLQMDFSLPDPKQCELYYVDRDILFGYSPLAETFLQQMVSLFVSSHYKNSPNDLMMMSDAPAHQLFCLLPPPSASPPVLCVIQVALEGGLSQEAHKAEQAHGRRASGDLIPWIISQQFQDDSFPSLVGARIVRIATHSVCQKKGYGKRALELLTQFYSSKVKPLSDETNKRSLLRKLTNVSHLPLDYLGVSYGLVPELFRFWKKSDFLPLYIRQTPSEVTAEHSCVMVKVLNPSTSELISSFHSDFRERFLSLLPMSFCNLLPSLVLQVLNCSHDLRLRDISPQVTDWMFSTRSLQRIDAYTLHQVDYHLVLDLLPRVSHCYFSTSLYGCLSSAMENILVCLGLQNKSVEQAAVELSMESQQILGFFKTALKKMYHRLNTKNALGGCAMSKRKDFNSLNGKEHSFYATKDKYKKRKYQL